MNNAQEPLAANVAENHTDWQTDPVAVAVAQRVNIEIPLHKRAFEIWYKARRSELETQPLGQVVHRFQSPEVHARVLDYFVADVLENVVLLQARLAEQKRKQAALELKAAIAEHDLFFEQDEDTIDVHRGEVRRLNKAEQLEFVRRIVEFSRDLATGNAGITPEELLRGKQPPQLRGLPIGDYASDLAQLLVTDLDNARALILEICTDENLARHVAEDPESPPVLKQLATLSCRLAAAHASKRARPEPVGFHR